MTTKKNSKHTYFTFAVIRYFHYFPYTLIPQFLHISLISLISLFSLLTHAQNSDSINYLVESNKIFKTNIKTVLFHRDGWDMSAPVIRLNTDEKLKLSFDDLDADFKDFSFTILHCNADWSPSGLDRNEYIDGYIEDNIRDYQFSLNTLIPYTHYELVFPTDDMKPKLSGNYILKVYVDDPDSLCFTRRFFMVEQKVGIEGKVKQATMIEDRNYKQEVDFSVSIKGYRMSNPYQDLKVIIIQNGRWDNRISDLKPKMMVNDKLDYDYNRENVFQGGNEFRSIDIKSLKYNTENIASIKRENEGYDVYLRDGQRRSSQVYKTEKDINGQMKIKTEDGTTTETEAEYVMVHFFLPYAAPMIDAEFFIVGQITDWQFSGESKMNYNFKRKGYEKSLLLKQGYYNYHYILKYHDQTAGDESFIEGTHSETENSYTIFIYYHETAAGYDKLIGVKYLSSLPEN
jgi:hypothetical protein